MNTYKILLISSLNDDFSLNKLKQNQRKYYNLPIKFSVLMLTFYGKSALKS